MLLCSSVARKPVWRELPLAVRSQSALDLAPGCGIRDGRSWLALQSLEFALSEQKGQLQYLGLLPGMSA